ncbi:MULTISPECIES: SCO3242 family prenyltransferase [unclassified Solwaraspora]|uniref:SCO3242 family prenyltransferase n=1 Tax=unclassified Solwaraspora TaxID=2627926 RepID=UPI00248C389F|nr:MULTISPECIES: UbiA family prenyltransferase [unclassified Solwaraspora]WBB95349.1 UbiA family prenyltransferase [Solwaraspora sp. WMMA2059]WBC20745.1 UbiA family prenyltransferase [Solwaraspora sp. WMMA2080]WJK37122.1 UbiA family prenyltransferase [Solwaraspora sp. WMMA2065]
MTPPRWSDLAELVRAPAALSVPGDVVAGAAAAGGLGPRTVGLAGASVCLYWAGMAANDWADRELDAVERPQRPIPSGRVTPGAALAVAAGLTTAGLALTAVTGGRRALAVGVPLTAAVWAYDLWAKNTPAGPAVMAACRGLDVLLGSAGTGRTRAALPAALAVAAHTYTVTELSRSEVSGADPRLPAATLAGTAAIALASAASATGRAVSVRAPAAGRASAARASVAGRATSARWWRAGVTAGLAGWYAARYGAAQAAVARDPRPEQVRAAVGAGIVGLPALQGALTARAAATGTGLATAVGLAVSVAAPLGRRLARRVSPT